MNKMIDMTKQELRTIIEEAFRGAKKEKLPSNELKELLKFSEDGKAWGGFIFRLMREKILEKDDEKPIKDRNHRYYYYKLVKDVLADDKPKQTREEEFHIFNDTTKEYEVVFGSAEMDKRVDSILATNDYILKILKVVEIAKPRRTIDRERLI